MNKIVTTITDLIGGTPIVKLNKLVPENGAEIYAKLEFFNPGGSVKDRVALSMIEQAEKDGTLKKGFTIVEPTSGNTGIGLAMVAAAKGYEIIIVMPDTMSIERQKIMKAYGANLILTPGAKGMKGAIDKAAELASRSDYYMPMQFDNSANAQAHEETTSREILEAFEGKKIDAFISAVGTGGTITGISTTLKKAYPNIEISAVEPKESPVLGGGIAGPHKIQGIGAGFIPKVLNTKSYDNIIEVKSEDALETARQVAITEGLLVGISAGAVIKAAIDKSRELGKGKKIIVIVPDNGERYLSTELYQN